MLNFEIDPKIMRPLVPAGTELDDWQGRTFVSIVGFRFLDTRVMGVGIPFHRDFEEVNLRFYVRRKSVDGWRRGVVFIKELVPRVAIATLARLLYNEPYTALPMGHTIDVNHAFGQSTQRVTYRWQFQGYESELHVTTCGEPYDIAPGSEEAFITERYWGYTRQRNGTTIEYEVEHPCWRVWTAQEARLACDVARLYGPQFVESLKAAPTSAFLADGSGVTVFRGDVIEFGETTASRTALSATMQS
jgi:hypothetical protein